MARPISAEAHGLQSTLKNRSAQLFPDELTVSLIGWLPGSAFSAGDLYAEQLSVDRAVAWGSMLPIGEADGPLDSRDPPVLGKSEFLFKLEQVD